MKGLDRSPLNGAAVMSIAIYVRVSSKGQDTASQEPDLARWAANQKGDVVYYRDRFTGKSMSRPGFNRMMGDVRTGKVRTIAIWRLDRLGRTASGLATLFDELKSTGVNLISLKDGLDLSTPAGTLMANVLASVAQFETEVRSERVKAGIAAAREDGRTWGGRKKGVRVKVTTEQEVLIRRLHAEGSKVSHIAKSVGLSRPSIYTIIA